MMTVSLMTTLLMLLKMTCVLVVALAVTLAMRRESAGARHLVWLVAFAALLALPALATWAPVPIRVLPVTAPAFPGSSDVLLGSPSILTRQPVSLAMPHAVSPAPAMDPEAAAPAAAIGATSGRRPIDVGSALAGLWALVAVVLLGRLFVGAWWVRRTVREARPIEGAAWQQPLVELADRLELRDVPELRRSDRVSIPFTSGWLGAQIVLPAASDRWSAEQRCAVLIHELAHVRRRDLIGHTASRIACALYWFHPLVWSAARRLRAESERACDDVALELGVQPSDYAEHLLDIASQIRAREMPAVALAMANPNEFEDACWPS